MQSRQRGFYVGSHTPYGYLRIKVCDGGRQRSKLEAHPHEAQVVAHMFNEVLKGSGLTEITRDLNRDGIAGPGSKGWSKTTVHKTLTNEAYTGTLVWGKNSTRNLPQIRVENAWPKIVDRGDFEQVRTLLKSRAPSHLHPKRTASHFLLSGIARCGYCGKALVGHDAKSGRFSYYVCGTLLKKGAGACPTRYINSKELEGLVISKIKEHVLIEENLRKMVSLINEEMDAASTEYRAQLDTVTEEVEDVNRRLDRIYDAIETGSFRNEDLAPRIRQLNERKEQLHAKKWELEWQLKHRKVELADIETVTHYVEDLRNLLSESSFTKTKLFVRSFVKEAKITDNDVCLTYTIPILPEDTTQEAIPVLSIVRYGGAAVSIGRTFSLNFRLAID